MQVYNNINIHEHFREGGLKEKSYYGITKLKQIEKESRIQKNKRETLRECTVEIIKIGRSFVKETRELAEKARITGSVEHIIKTTFTFFEKQDDN